MPPQPQPNRIRLFVYQVGFGDCFLLKFEYGNRFERNVLIDFGTMAYPKDFSDSKKSAWMRKVALKIREDANERIHVVVATHRHKDHISGFATRADGTGPGDVIRSCRPLRVIQPWTEHPDAEETATSARSRAQIRSFVDRLENMHLVAEAAQGLGSRRLRGVSRDTLLKLSYLGENNIKNKSAVENLMTMGADGKARYVRFGRSPALGSILPGVRVSVLGPPDLTQTTAIQTQRDEDEDEFWQLLAALGDRPDIGSTPLFPDAKTGGDPIDARWFRRQMQQLRAETLLQIVTRLDDQMNNTSLILLFEAGGKKLLFPGDAQYENWMYALDQASVRNQLGDVDLYKVGHHGSRNATPKTLWGLFRNRSTAVNHPARLHSVMSTREDVHGEVENRSEVPRSSLVDALRQDSDLLTTEDFGSDDIRQVVEIL